MGLEGGSGPMSGRAISGEGISGRAMNARVEDYLARLEEGLAGLSREEAADIVGELRSHILEKAALTGEANPAAIENTLSSAIRRSSPRSGLLVNRPGCWSSEALDQRIARLALHAAHL